jgi:hypothetical protein
LDLNNGQVSSQWSLNKVIKSLNYAKVAKTTTDSNENKLVDEIHQAIMELENIRKYFEFAQDPDLIDYVIYSEKAAVTRLSYLLKKAKTIQDVSNY